MEGSEIYKKAMLLLGYNDIINNQSLQARFEEQGSDLISQIAADLRISGIPSLSVDLSASSAQTEALIYGIKRLYEDNVLGRVTDEQYRMLSGDYTDEQG